jgi:molybdopterin synthase sulfur carrier subunit
MQGITEGQERVQVSGATVRQIINNLARQFPDIKDLLYDEEEDDLMPGLAVIIDGEAGQLGLLDRVGEDSEVHFLPAIGGGGLD